MAAKSTWTPPMGRHPVTVGKSLADALKRGAPGKSLHNRHFYSFRYNFIPESVDMGKPGTIEKKGGEMRVERASAQSTDQSYIFRVKESTPGPGDCLLLYDEETGEFTLEKVFSNINHQFDRKTDHPPRLAGSPRPPGEPSSSRSSAQPPTRRVKSEREPDADRDLTDQLERELLAVSGAPALREEEEEDGELDNLLLDIAVSPAPSPSLPPKPVAATSASASTSKPALPKPTKVIPADPTQPRTIKPINFTKKPKPQESESEGEIVEEPVRKPKAQPRPRPVAAPTRPSTSNSGSASTSSSASPLGAAAPPARNGLISTNDRAKGKARKDGLAVSAAQTQARPAASPAQRPLASPVTKVPPPTQTQPAKPRASRASPLPSPLPPKPVAATTGKASPVPTRPSPAPGKPTPVPPKQSQAQEHSRASPAPPKPTQAPPKTLSLTAKPATAPTNAPPASQKLAATAAVAPAATSTTATGKGKMTKEAMLSKKRQRPVDPDDETPLAITTQISPPKRAKTSVSSAKEKEKEKAKQEKQEKVFSLALPGSSAPPALPPKPVPPPISASAPVGLSLPGSSSTAVSLPPAPIAPAVSGASAQDDSEEEDWDEVGLTAAAPISASTSALAVPPPPRFIMMEEIDPAPVPRTLPVDEGEEEDEDEEIDMNAFADEMDQELGQADADMGDAVEGADAGMDEEEDFLGKALGGDWGEGLDDDYSSSSEDSDDD